MKALYHEEGKHLGTDGGAGWGGSYHSTNHLTQGCQLEKWNPTEEQNPTGRGAGSKETCERMTIHIRKIRFGHLVTWEVR